MLLPSPRSTDAWPSTATGHRRGGLEQRPGWHPEPARDPDQRSDRDVLSGLERLEVLERHFQPLRGLLLGEFERSTDLCDSPPDVRDDLIGVLVHDAHAALRGLPVKTTRTYGITRLEDFS